jgi:hypothetical protein
VFDHDASILDVWGQLLDIYRFRGESDCSFRQRLHSALRGEPKMFTIQTTPNHVNIFATLVGAEYSGSPCDYCNLESICDQYGYQQGCSEYQEYQARGQDYTSTQSHCCVQFRPFTGSCKVHPGEKENNGTCDDFESMGGDDCKVKGCSCK